MATLYITEFTAMGFDVIGRQTYTSMEPPVAEQTVAIAASSAQSSTVNAETLLVRIHTDSNCSIAIGTNPTATTASRRLPANAVEYVTVPKGKDYRIAVIENNT